VNGYEVDNLPIVLPIPPVIGTLASSIIEAKVIEENADTSTLENEIDKQVYHLYGLTYDEVLIIDRNPPFSREDYEGFEQPKN